ncbi:DEAD/DEAH box helicase family protein [Gemmata sp. G18]|uniref:DEAD/DEAH box helicase family protein n=1 Tax=Gemmata palustris TaxID=2822762 RepID=A0ABS5BL13_9BACT|nr:DEAD/DEAH box helicase family protein [Gemmata palustris]MBP3954386.1 DEAD/DEAH box helicase family protein [Gemmata palustris]
MCFALATGVGKTRLMGAFIGYLYLAHGIKNFLVLAPNLTIYNKLVADFTPNTKKYVFRGIAEFAIDPPSIITGDNYQSQATSLFDTPTTARSISSISRRSTVRFAVASRRESRRWWSTSANPTSTTSPA